MNLPHNNLANMNDKSFAIDPHVAEPRHIVSICTDTTAKALTTDVDFEASGHIPMAGERTQSMPLMLRSEYEFIPTRVLPGVMSFMCKATGE